MVKTEADKPESKAGGETGVGLTQRPRRSPSPRTARSPSRRTI